MENFSKQTPAPLSQISPDRWFTLISGIDSTNEQLLHRQSDYEIQYIVSGQGYITVNGKKLFLSAGDYVILTPNDRHSLKPRGGIRFYSLEFSVQDYSAGYPLYEELRNLLLRRDEVPAVSYNNIMLKSLFENLLKEWQERRPMYIIQITLLFQQILLQCCRDYHSGTDAGNPEGQEDDEILDAFLSFISAYIDDPDVLALFEKNYGYNRAALTQLAKRKFGKTIFQLYTEKRFEYALSLLFEGRSSVTDIAGKCGFSSVAAFSKAFKQHFGMSPSRYMQMHAPPDREIRDDIYLDFSLCTSLNSGAMFPKTAPRESENAAEYKNPKLQLL